MENYCIEFEVFGVCVAKKFAQALRCELYSFVEKTNTVNPAYCTLQGPREKLQRLFREYSRLTKYYIDGNVCKIKAVKVVSLSIFERDSKDIEPKALAALAAHWHRSTSFIATNCDLDLPRSAILDEIGYLSVHTRLKNLRD